MNLSVKCWITNINIALIAVMPTLTSSLLTHKAIAEDAGFCFMVTPSGRTVELTKLCHHTTQTQATSSQKVFRVPIKRRFGRTPVIDVTFNNQKTFEMILDTGANSTLITQGMANTLQIKATGIMQAQVADGTQIKFPTVKVNSIAAGGLIANNLEIAIAPKAGIGLLGHDFFGDYDIKISATAVEFHQR
ncbi:retroviral-like aspartic protease family protein [Nostoc sp. FACHB-152]|uniref:retropepsin-like aspartic protease family protein n=1 Tax=unclassified Nostoc TaxID=2593658 RepID=UPI0016890D6D|nr:MULTISPECIES: retropepsin-like aspartic protease [unclassified Nostoc]MBD2448521.1 retroviral-like aspartic protease family protein [Nostoc sp. FACHB-152]MBD2466258.1 retroviral-like aspartic protease family protein [Nostoc sp. FACHB-145]